jgi:AraC-like DNA-binding protein
MPLAQVAKARGLSLPASVLLKESGVAAHATPANLSAGIIAAVMEALTALGLDEELLLHHAGLSRAMLATSSNRIEHAALHRVWAAAEQLSNDPHIGLTVGTHLGPGTLGALDYLIRNSASLRHCIELAGRFVRVVDDHVRLTLIEADGTAIFRITREGTYDYNRHDMECTFAAIVQGVGRELIELRPSEVRFAHAMVKPEQRYKEVFSGRLRFSASHYELVFPSTFLEAPPRNRDARLGTVLEEHVTTLLDAVPPADFVASVRNALQVQFSEGDASLEAVARALHLSARTLRRRLSAHKTSFREQVEELRADLGRTRVADNGRPLKAIAAELGFSDQSTFQRAFKRWTGLTPAQYRERHGKASGP